VDPERLPDLSSQRRQAADEIITRPLRPSEFRYRVKRLLDVNEEGAADSPTAGANGTRQKPGKEGGPDSSGREPEEGTGAGDDSAPEGTPPGWHNLADVHPAPILVTIGGEIVYINPAGVDLLGAECRGVLLGACLSDFVEDEAVLETIRTRRRKVENGQATPPVMHEIVDRNGRRRMVEVSSTPIRYDGKPAAQTIVRDRTRARERERTARNRQVRLRGLAHSIPGVLYNFHVDEDGRYTSSFISSQAEAMLGISTEPMDTFFDRFVSRIPEPHRSAFAESVGTAVEEERDWTFETPFIRPDGTRIWLQCRSHPDRRNEDIVFSGVLLEITERKKAEETLRERESRLEGLAGSVPGVIYQFYARPGSEYGLHYVSQQAESVLGMNPDPEGFFDRFVDRVVGETAADLLDSIDRAVERAEPWTFLMPFRKPNGEVIWIEGNAAPEMRDGEIVFNGVLLDVTDRQRARRALQRERSRLHTLFESLPTPVIRCTVEDAGAQLEAANESFREVFGLSPDEDAGAVVEEHIVPEGEGDEAVRVNHEAVQEGTLQAEVQRETTDGLRDFQLQIAGRIEDDHPEVFGIYTDITQQKRQERRAQRRRRKTEALYTATQRLLSTDGRSGVADVVTDVVRDTFEYPGVVVRFAEDGVLQAVRVSGTRRFRDLSFPPVAIDGPSPLADVYRSGNSACFDDLTEVQTACAAADVLRSAVCIPLDDHGILVVDAFERGAVSDEDVRLLEILGANAAAVLDRIDRQTALEESEATYRGIIDCARDSIYVLDEDGRFVSVNASTAHMLGTTVDDLIGRPLADVLDTSRTDPKRAAAHLARAFNGEVQRLEVWAERDDGSSFPKDVRLQRAEYFGQTVVLGVGRDIEARKRREKALREAKQRAERARREADAARKEAEEANKMKSSFLANMSHEIRTPLTSIIGFAEAIGSEVGEAQTEESDLDRSTLVRFADLIERSGEQLMEMLNGVLNLSKLEAGEIALEPETVELLEQLHGVVEEFQLRAEKNGLRVRLETPAEPIRVHANSQGMRIVLRNLVSNAIKYTEEGGTIWVRGRRRDHREEGIPGAVVEVEDTGVGMDEEFLEKAFRAFYQESTGPAREFEGTGLGLAVVKKTVSGMNGDIDIETEKGEGTCVTVWLPEAEVGRS
jgi:PAS domain S-box-containing protein